MLYDKIQKNVILLLILVLVLIAQVTANHNIISKIGILTLMPEKSWEYYQSNQYQFIAASAVKFAEMGAAQVIPISWKSSKQQLNNYFQYVNGLIIVGQNNTEMLENQQFIDAATYLIQLSDQSNIQGKPFPLLAIGTGFNLLVKIISGEEQIEFTKLKNIKQKCLSLQVTQNGKQGLFNLHEQQLIDMHDKKLAYFYQNFILQKRNFKNNQHLSDYFTIAAYAKNYKNQEFIAALQNKNGYPIYALQFNIEMIPFEWDFKGINNGKQALQMVQSISNLFTKHAQQNRIKNDNVIPSHIQEKYLINNQPLIIMERPALSQIYLMKDLPDLSLASSSQ